MVGQTVDCCNNGEKFEADGAAKVGAQQCCSGMKAHQKGWET